MKKNSARKSDNEMKQSRRERKDKINNSIQVGRKIEEEKIY